LPHILKFANFEFIFAIGKPKLAREGVVDKIFKHKIGGPLFTCTPWNDLGRQLRLGRTAPCIAPAEGKCKNCPLFCAV